MLSLKTSFLSAFLWMILISGVWLGLDFSVNSLLAYTVLSPQSQSMLSGLLVAVGVLFFTLLFERRISKTNTIMSLKALGFKSCTFRQLRVVAVGMLPLLFGYLYIFFVLKKSAELEPNAWLMIVKFIVAQGIVEEVVFRGFIFRHLRYERSFIRAALLSSVIFSAVHLMNFTNGVSSEVIQSILISMGVAFFAGIPFAALFELGTGSIVGGAIWHLALDSNNWFRDLGDSSGSARNVYLISILVSLGVVTFLSYRKTRA